MYIDAQALFSDAQALTASAASTNLIDFGADRNIGIGEPMCAVIVLDVAADGTTGDETYSVGLEVDDNSSFSSATSIGTATITRSDAAGSRYVIAVPPSLSAERYMRLYYTLGGTTPTATVTSFLIPMNMLQNYVSYADGFTIS